MRLPGKSKTIDKLWHHVESIHALELAVFRLRVIAVDKYACEASILQR